ncbi:MAG: hypothetical protein QM734_12980 [Cyclobacteriaceae bacterium]
MESHYSLTDLEFEIQFSLASLNPKLFNHEAHLRLAWIHITKYGVGSAIENICSQLKYFTQSIGAADKYNETVTVAAVRAVDHFIRKSNHSTFQKFIEENSRLKTHFKDLISSHYRTDIFNSASAKKLFLEPELMPFD